VYMGNFEIHNGSVCAYLGYSLRAMERYLEQRELYCEEVTALLEDLWRVPQLIRPSCNDNLTEPWQFVSWLTRVDRPELSYFYADELDLPAELLANLHSKNIAIPIFADSIEALSQICRSCLFGAVEIENVKCNVKRILNLVKRDIVLPDVEVFQISRLEINNGWGHCLTDEELEKWRVS